MKRHLGVSVSTYSIDSDAVSRSILLDLRSPWATQGPIQVRSDAALIRFAEGYQTRAIDGKRQAYYFPGSVAATHCHLPPT